MDIKLGFNMNQKLVEDAQVKSGSILANGAEDVAITPPEGYIGILKQFGTFCAAPTGAGSGAHSFVLYGGTNVNVRVFSLTSAYNATLQTLGSSVVSGTPVPTDQAAIAYIFNNFTFSHDYPLILRYGNFTNVTQTNARSFDIQYIIESESDF